MPTRDDMFASYINPRNMREPMTLVIASVEWDEICEEGLIYFVDHPRPYAIRDHDWQALYAITGEHDVARWPGRTVRFYPVNYPEPEIEPF